MTADVNSVLDKIRNNKILTMSCTSLEVQLWLFISIVEYQNILI